MKITFNATKGCVKISSNYNFFNDRFLNVFKTVEEASTKGVEYCGTSKATTKICFLSILGKLMKVWQGGSYIVIKSTTIVPVDRPMMVARCE